MYPRFCCRGVELSRLCLLMRCGFFQALVHLDVGVGEGVSIGESGASFFVWRMARIYSVVWRR